MENEIKTEKMEKGKFAVIVLAIIFDPEKRKILIGKRENDPYVEKLSWVFPGGRITTEERGTDSQKKNKRRNRIKSRKSGNCIFKNIS